MNVKVTYWLGAKTVLSCRGANNQGKHRESDVTELNWNGERPRRSVCEQVVYL
jgi:hypothetical protein